MKEFEMTKNTMQELIDSENGKGFSENIDLEGYNFYKNSSFISFKINTIDGVTFVNVHYIYADNSKDLLSIFAYACNFWMGMKVKFIYYKEKEKTINNYALKLLREYNFDIIKGDSIAKWKSRFECSKCHKIPCNCSLIEAYKTST